MSERIPITEAALRLSLSYQQVRHRILTGQLRGGRDQFGRFYVEAAEIERLLRQAATLATGKEVA
jgi:hypothetical protein